MSNSARRVVFTGVGAVTPLAHDSLSTWEAMKAGKSGVGKITLFDASGYPTQIAAEVRDFPFEKMRADFGGLEHASRNTWFALKAATEAYEQSGLAGSGVDANRFGIYLGAGDNGHDFEGFVKAIRASVSEAGVDGRKFYEAAMSEINAEQEIEMHPFMTLGRIANQFNCKGPASNCLTACAASSQAIGEAFELIRRGDADVMMSGGVHAMIYPFGIAGFSGLTALSRRNDAPEEASRPFDKNRDGFVMAEGAGIVIMEELEHALARNAVILGELSGYGTTADSYRPTDMDPEGYGGQRAIRMALRKGGIQPDQVDYINAHGTSTAVNDVAETRVIKSVFGDRAYKIPVSSVKSMLGHPIAAAGAIEIITCLYALKDSIIPPTINYKEPDPTCDLDYVPNEARSASLNVVLSNSFGFGGQNICLAVKKYDG